MTDELNRLMAEKVMGWEERHTSGVLTAWHDVSEDEHTSFRFWTLEGNGYWNPCDNIEQAFMCVEKILADNPTWNFTLDIEAGDDYVAMFGESADIGWIGHGSGSTKDDIPLAIVEAIAQVLEEDQDGE